MKVWLVWSGEYEQAGVCGVFSSREKADAYIAAQAALYPYIPQDHWYLLMEDGEEVDELCGTEVRP